MPPTNAGRFPVIGMPYSGKVRVLNMLAVLERFRIRSRLRPSSPSATKVACYYGCLLVRPAKCAQFDRVEDPQTMDQVMAAAGAKPVRWSSKTECCGAGVSSVTRTDLVANLSGRIVADATRREARRHRYGRLMCQSTWICVVPRSTRSCRRNTPSRCCTSRRPWAWPWASTHNGSVCNGYGASRTAGTRT